MFFFFLKSISSCENFDDPLEVLFSMKNRFGESPSHFISPFFFNILKERTFKHSLKSKKRKNNSKKKKTKKVFFDNLRFINTPMSKSNTFDKIVFYQQKICLLSSFLGEVNPNDPTDNQISIKPIKNRLRKKK